MSIDLAGEHLTIQAMPAAEWLGILMGSAVDLDDVLPGLLDEGEAEQVEDALFNGVLDLEQLHQTALDVITEASGRMWYVAMKIIASAEASWNVIGGEFVIRNVDASRISLSSWLDAAYLILLKNMSNSEANIFNARLQVPPPGFMQPDEEPTLTAESFLAMGSD